MNKARRGATVLSTAVAATVACLGTARGAEWNNPAGGVFNTPSNWTPALVPSTFDTVFFRLNSTYGVDFTGGITTGGLYVSRGDVTFNLNNQTYTVSQFVFPFSFVGPVQVGDQAGHEGRLTLKGGRLSSSDGTIGVNAGSTGRVTVSTGATWANSSWVIAGSSGTGSLVVEGGGQVNNGMGYVGWGAGSSGSATVTGAGSLWNNTGDLAVGDAGTGVLDITAGGRVSNAGGRIGSTSGSSGSATVTGAGSRWVNSGGLDVGNAGSGTLLVQGGGLVSSGVSYLGHAAGSTGSATVSGNNSAWNASGTLWVGGSGTGHLRVEQGADVTSIASSIGGNSGSTGSVTVTGAGSTWQNTLSNLFVGGVGTGTLLVESGGEVTVAGSATVGVFSGSDGEATVSGPGSKWTMNANLEVGGSGDGTLRVAGGGQARAAAGLIGNVAGSKGSATVTGAGSTWTNVGNGTNFIVGNAGAGTLRVEAGGQVNATGSSAVGNQAGGGGEATVVGTGSAWTTTNFLDVGVSGAGTLRVEGGGHVSNSFGTVGTSSTGFGVATVTGAGSRWTNSGSLNVARSGYGTLNVEAGGQVTSGGASGIGYQAGSYGTATITGAGSNWLSNGMLTVGGAGSGTLRIENGGRVESNAGEVGRFNGGTGSVSVVGPGSTWDVDGSLLMGGGDLFSVSGGQAALTIGAGGTVYVGEQLGLYWGGPSINLQGGTLRFNSYLRLGGTINYALGTVQLGGNRSIGADAAITDFFGSAPTINAGKALAVEGKATLLSNLTIDGGHFSAGALENVALLNFKKGTLGITGPAGLAIGGGGTFGDTLELGNQQNIQVTQEAVVQADGLLTVNAGGTFTSGALRNSGVVEGGGRVHADVFNSAGGRIRSGGGQRLRFTGLNFSNAGVIETIGTAFAPAELDVQSASFAVNEPGTGFIAARNATLRFNGGLANEGSLGISYGTTDVFGDVNNDDGAIQVSGGGQATFYDDLTQNGSMQVVKVGSTTSVAVLFGAFTGAGGFTGGGDVFALGDLRPGNSPGVVTYGGNLLLGDSTHTVIELGGTTPGSFDQMVVTGDLALDGRLTVALIDGFALAESQQFLIAEVGDLLSGSFTGLGEGASVGRFGGQDLFITYRAGDGNDVALSTVPEPAGVSLLGVGLLSLLARRARRRG